jgi:hypothetical protein
MGKEVQGQSLRLELFFGSGMVVHWLPPALLRNAKERAVSNVSAERTRAIKESVKSSNQGVRTRAIRVVERCQQRIACPVRLPTWDTEGNCSASLEKLVSNIGSFSQRLLGGKNFKANNSKIV